MARIDRRHRPLFYPEERGGIFYPDPDDGPFVIDGHWAIDTDRDQPCLVGISIWKQAVPVYDDKGGLSAYRRLSGAPPVPDLSGTDLREVAAVARVKEALWLELERVLTARRRQFAELASSKDKNLAELAGATVAGYSRRMPAGRPGRVNPDDAAHFRAVADVYREALRGPGRKRPTMTVMRRWDVSHSTATKWVRRARDEFGYLPPASPGRPSIAAAKRTVRRVK